MIRLKGGVRLLGIRPEVLFALQVIDGAYRNASCLETWVTSGTEGTHSQGSKHYSGDAADVGTKNARVLGVDIPLLVSKIKEALGPDFDVVLEDVGQANEHIHVEFDPKSPY